MTELKTTKIFECDCHAEAITLEPYFGKYNPKTKTGLNVETDPFGKSNQYVVIDLDFWYRGTGKGYYDVLKQRLWAAYRILVGRRTTFESFTFNPGQIREIGEHFIEEADRLNQLGYNNDGVKEEV